MSRNTPRFVIAGFLVVLVFALVACQPPEPELGSPELPIIMSFVPSADTQEVLAGAEDIGAAVSEITGYTIVTNVATEYAGVITAMCNGEAHVGALNTFGYVLANEQGCADVGLTSVRFGTTTYAGQVITRADSGISSIEDLAGKTFCRPDPLSTSGWIIPSLALRAVGLDPEADLAQIVDAGGHDGVVTAVYNGDCDAGSTFVDARSNIADEYPDVNEVVIVIAESPPIPNDTISFIPSIPEDIRANIVAAFLELAGDDASRELLNSVYRWDGLQEVDDTFYDAFRQQLDAAGLDITDLSQ
jgi:phosphonate transport system substrate-binding protein